MTTHESRHVVVPKTAEFEADIVVEESHSNLVQLLGDETNVLQIGGPVDLLDDAALDVVRQCLKCFLCWYCWYAMKPRDPVLGWPQRHDSIRLGGSVHGHVRGDPVLSSRQPETPVGRTEAIGVRAEPDDGW